MFSICVNRRHYLPHHCLNTVGPGKTNCVSFREHRGLGLCDREGRTEDTEGEGDGEDRLQEVRREGGPRGYWSNRVFASGSVRRRSGRPRRSPLVRPPQDDEQERLLRREAAPTSSHRRTRESR